jgi:hypothetical protein
MNIPKFMENEVEEALEAFEYIVWASNIKQTGNTHIAEITLRNRIIANNKTILVGDIKKTIKLKYRKGRLKIFTPVWFRLAWGWRKLTSLKLMRTIYYVDTQEVSND